MTSMQGNGTSVLLPAEIQVGSDGGAAARRPRLLESLGRVMIRRAMTHLRWGRVRIVDERLGEVIESAEVPDDQPRVTVRVHDSSFYSSAAFGGELGIAESRMDGAWEADDLAGLIEIMTVNLAATESLNGALSAALAPLSRAAYWLERNTRAGSRRNIVAHYDLGNEFFGLFLDPSMTYSCAVFENEARSLEEAQREKIDRACRKLGLGPNDHLLEIGSGWGALATHAAAKYGCRVTTTTLSGEQKRLTEERVRAARLEDQITVLSCDYRDLKGQFDKIVSIEMIEAVGAEHLGGYFEACSRLLKPDGAALIQAIVIRDQFFKRAAGRRDFLKKYIFPGSCLPSVAAMQESVAARTDLRLWHLEDIGPYYITTLQKWREAFVSKLGEVKRMGFDDRFIRMWDYYFCYCEGAFRARHVGDVQMLLTKPLCRMAPAGPSAAGVL